MAAFEQAVAKADFSASIQLFGACRSHYLNTDINVATRSIGIRANLVRLGDQLLGLGQFEIG